MENRGLPGPRELGELVERGEMTEGEAADVMAERVRCQALPWLAPEEKESREMTPSSPARGLVVALSVGLVVLVLMLWLI